MTKRKRAWRFLRTMEGRWAFLSFYVLCERAGKERLALSQATKNRKKQEWMEWLKALIVVAVVLVVVRGFLFSTVQVKGTSMEPNFIHQDTVVLNRMSYVVGNVQRGDVIVCRQVWSTGEENLIKRVIGLPGDEIDMVRQQDGSYQVAVNGTVLEEPYLKEPMEQIGDQEYPYTVPEDCYFVMGDNRNQSNDSRFLAVGAIPQDQIYGKVVLRIWPISRFAVF